MVESDKDGADQMTDTTKTFMLHYRIASAETGRILDEDETRDVLMRTLSDEMCVFDDSPLPDIVAMKQRLRELGA